jgi:hypothetical protein
MLRRSFEKVWNKPSLDSITSGPRGCFRPAFQNPKLLEFTVSIRISTMNPSKRPQKGAKHAKKEDEEKSHRKQTSSGNRPKGVSLWIDPRRYCAIYSGSY